MSGPLRAAESRHVPTVAVIDLEPGHHVLLTATLRSLGCDVYPVDCSGRCPETLDAQLASHGPFDVVFWDLSLGPTPHPWVPALVRGAGGFGRSGIVIAASHGQEVPRLRQHSDEQTLLLLKPFTPSTLMTAVNAAVTRGRSYQTTAPPTKP